MAPATARTKRAPTNPRSAFPILRMFLLAVLLLTTLRLIPNWILCLWRRLIHPSAWRDCLESPRGTNVRPPERPKSSYFDLSGLRIPVGFAAETARHILSRQFRKGSSPKFAPRGF